MEPELDYSHLAAKLFPLLFNMMGPLGLIPAFAGLTAGMDPATRNGVARRAAGLASIALVLAVFLGAAMLGAWSIGKGSLIFAAGLIVTATAMLPLLGAGGGAPGPSGDSKRSPDQLAVTPLAFPNMVTPRAVAVLIIFIAYFPTLRGKLTVVAVAWFVLLLNLIGMRYAHAFMEKVGMTPLLVLGAVFGVLQVALGVEMMANGWRAWSALP